MRIIVAQHSRQRDQPHGNNGGADNNFRFFTSDGDWASGRNYPYYADAGYTIDADLTNAMDGDSNFAFVGTTGYYYLEIDDTNKTIILDSPRSYGNCELDVLYGVGAGLPDAGWAWTSPVILNCTGEGVYTAFVSLQNNGGADNNFRFFTSEGDWASGLNYPYFADAGYTIDSNFEDAMDGDNNFAFTGVTGYYYLEIDTTNKTIILSDPQSYGTCEFDVLYGVGAGLPTAGWGWTTPVIFNCTGEGAYTAYVELQNNGGADNNFRFFTSDGDWASGRNYPWYVDAGYTIDSNFEDAMDGDNNFAFVGTSGTYFLTIDDTNKTITLE